jgi:hypothetical protein
VKKQELLHRIEKLEMELANLRMQIAMLPRPAPVSPYTFPHPPWLPSPTTAPIPPIWPGTICEVARSN